MRPHRDVRTSAEWIDEQEMRQAEQRKIENKRSFQAVAIERVRPARDVKVVKRHEVADPVMGRQESEDSENEEGTVKANGQRRASA